MFGLVSIDWLICRLIHGMMLCCMSGMILCYVVDWYCRLVGWYLDQICLGMLWYWFSTINDCWFNDRWLDQICWIVGPICLIMMEYVGLVINMFGLIVCCWFNDYVLCWIDVMICLLLYLITSLIQIELDYDISWFSSNSYIMINCIKSKHW